jgi:probable rRNA maturation factor
LILNIDIQYILGAKAALEHRCALSAAAARRYASAAIDGTRVKAAQFTLRIVGQAEGRALNLQYRGKDYATNILTFDYTRAPVLAADLVLCAPVVAKEARSLGIPLRQHYAHLLVHGALHAQGYDHETSERDADEMEALEVLILGSLGFANPYAQRDGNEYAQKQ